MSWGATSRWAVSIVAIVVTLLAAWVAMEPFGDPVSQRNADRIHEGMTRDQVVAIMGRKADGSHDWDDLRKEWWDHKTRRAILIVWLEKGKVNEQEFHDLDEGHSVWDRFVRWVGW